MKIQTKQKQKLNIPEQKTRANTSKCLFKTRKIVSSNPLLFFLSNEKLKLSQIRIITLRACLRAFLLFLLLSLVFLEEGSAYRCFLDLTCRAHFPEISVAHVAIDSLHGSDVSFLRPSLFLWMLGQNIGRFTFFFALEFDFRIFNEKVPLFTMLNKFPSLQK